MEPEAIETHRAEPDRRVGTKHRRTVDAGLFRGTVRFVFTDSELTPPGRISVQLDEPTVQGLPGAQSPKGRPFVLIQAPLAACLAYCGAPTAEAREGISLFGELGLLESLGAVVQAQQSAVSARTVEPPPAITLGKPTTIRERKSHVHPLHQ